MKNDEDTREIWVVIRGIGIIIGSVALFIFATTVAAGLGMHVVNFIGCG